jgi:iron complex outermembrane receptor protein
VFEPTRNISLGIDYYNIRQKNLVSSRNFQDILDDELATGSSRFVSRGDPTAEDIARGAPGPIVVVAVPFENLSEVRTSGYDFDLNVRVPVNGGTIHFGQALSYVLSYQQPDAPGDPLEELVGDYNLPRVKSITSLRYERPSWDVAATWNYTSSMAQSESAAADADPEIGSFATTDLQFNYKGIKNTRLTLGVKNIGNTEPPVSITEGLLYNIEHHSLRGRFFYGSLNYKF